MNSSVPSSIVERGIVDAGVVILGPVEHDRAAFERLGVLGIREIALAEILRITLVFMMAESNRLPLSTRKPALSSAACRNGG